MKSLKRGEEEYLMTGNTVHDVFLKVGHRQHAAHESISAFLEKKREHIGYICVEKGRGEGSTPKC